MATAIPVYYKRFQMEMDLRRWQRPRRFVPQGYRLHAWGAALADAHATVKFISFRDELDAVVFPCLGEHHGCARLVREISERDGFVPEATWLAEFRGDEPGAAAYCGTIQAIRTSRQRACIQNVGVTPAHRGRGVGAALVVASLWGMQQVGVSRAALEVTAQNELAVRLYRRLGFRAVKTIFKVLDEPAPPALATV